MNGLSLDVFTPKSWVSILDGMGCLPGKTYPLFDHIELGLAREQQMEFEAHRKEVISRQPQHYDHLKEVYNA